MATNSYIDNLKDFGKDIEPYVALDNPFKEFIPTKLIKTFQRLLYVKVYFLADEYARLMQDKWENKVHFIPIKEGGSVAFIGIGQALMLAPRLYTPADVDLQTTYEKLFAKWCESHNYGPEEALTYIGPIRTSSSQAMATGRAG